MKEPQIGIEPMTAWRANAVSAASLSGVDGTTEGNRAQGGAEARPTVRGIGNEVATRIRTAVLVSGGFAA